MSIVQRLRQRRLGRWLGFLLLSLILVSSGVGLFFSVPHARLTNNDASLNIVASQGFSAHYSQLKEMIKTLEATEARTRNEVVLDDTLNHTMTLIELDAAAGHRQTVRLEIQQFESQLRDWQSRANNQVNDVAPERAVITGVNLAPVVSPAADLIPIVMYHKTPPNFEQQLQLLQLRGYTTVTLQDVTASFAHRLKLPTKPIVLTFDDGFTDNMNAFNLLQKYRMKATFYIVNGGPISHWCIGAARRYNDPSQQIGGCGDAYLSWEQIRELDHSGLITIGGHTIDHVDLAIKTPDAQRHEIIDSKLAIEQELGHPIYDFAYPYGSYNSSAIAIVQQAGYTSAVTTVPGIYQDPTRPFTLKRVRDAGILQ